MMDDDQWFNNNNAYLSAAITWINLRLRRMIQRTTPTVVPLPPEPVTPTRRRWWSSDREQSPPSDTPLLLPAPLEHVSDEKVHEAWDAMQQIASNKPSPALCVLAERLNLSAFEQHILLVCAALEFDPDLERVCAKAHNDPHKAYPTFALAFTLI